MRASPVKISAVCRRAPLWLLLSALSAALWLWGVLLAPPPLSIAMVPLDSRPVNTDLPQQLAEIGGLHVALPPASLLDQFLTPSDRAGLMEWLKNQASESDLLVLHLNELLFGGLIESRTDSQYQDAEAKMADLEALLSAPEIRSKTIVLVYVLPRLLPSQYDPAMWAYQDALCGYSRLRHQLSENPGNQALRKAFEEQQTAIPREILAHYDMLFLEAGQVGNRLLDWADQRLADEVVIGLDDAAPYGMNVQVFQGLQETSQGQDQVYFLHGADELASLIIARHALAPLGSESLLPVFLTPGDETLVPPYEAASLKENFEEKKHYLYAPLASEQASAFAGSIHGAVENLRNARQPAARPKYVVIHSRAVLDASQISRAWQQVAQLRTALPSSPLIGLADTAQINGASKAFIDGIGLGAVYHYTDVYAGWNTAGNSMGTVISHLLFLEEGQTLRGSGRLASLEAHQKLQRLRLIDDYLYQIQVRSAFNQWAQTNGYAYLSFGDRWPEANAKIQSMMEEALAPYPGLMPENTSESKAGYRFSFPWPRSFELHIQPSTEGE